MRRENSIYTGATIPSTLENERMVTLTCKVCAKEFQLTKDALSCRTGNNCSRECAYVGNRVDKTRTCQNCYKKFVDRHPLKYCGKGCIKEAMSEKYKFKVCDICNKRFRMKGRFNDRKYCSPQCYFIAAKEPAKNYTCLNCGIVFSTRSTGNRTRKYCGNKCSNIHRRGKNHSLFLGNRRALRGDNWKKQSNLARIRDGNTCTNCGLIKEGRASVDHIVPFRYVNQFNDGRDPNDLVNLTCLCRTCHGRKTGTEYALLRGDVALFIERAKNYIPIDKLNMAVEFWGLSEGQTPTVTKRQAKDRLGCVVQGVQS